MMATTSNDRARLMGHRGLVVWFTGLSGAGKSTIAEAVEQHLTTHGMHAYRLDGDELRTGLSSDLGFSPRDREENVRRVGEVARLMADAGLIVLVALISPYRSDRDRVRERVGDRFVEVFVDTPLDICESRDPKGLYLRARQGLIPEFTGVSAPYEEPLHPELRIAAGSCTINDAVSQVSELVRQRCT